MPWMCTHSCKSLLPCEHPCSSTCGKCLQGWVCQQLQLGERALPNLATQQQGSSLTVELPSGTQRMQLPAPDQCSHAECRLACGRTLFCGHSCEGRCHPRSQCPPCAKPCGVRCSHSACQKKCGEYCPPCAEPCTWECPHEVGVAPAASWGLRSACIATSTMVE